MLLRQRDFFRCRAPCGGSPGCCSAQRTFSCHVSQTLQAARYRGERSPVQDACAEREVGHGVWSSDCL